VSGTEQAELASFIRKAAAACNVTPIVVRRWMARGWLPQPPWTLRKIHEVRDLNDAGRQLGIILGTGAVLAATEPQIVASGPSLI
jgi:hypothetical protein